MKRWPVQAILITAIGISLVAVVCLPESAVVQPGFKEEKSENYGSAGRQSVQEKFQIYDFGSDGILERVMMADGKLYVESVGPDERILFSSEDHQEVTDFGIGDINNDGRDELFFGFWREGDYGKNIPYAKARRDPLKSYHLYLYEYFEEHKVFHLLWGSSTLPHPVYGMKIVSENGKNILEVTEGSYEDYDRSGLIKPTKTTKWVWNEWWFEEK